MRILTTISGRTLKVSSNQSKRHYTIKTESGKYRTLPMGKDEFNNCQRNSGQDWQNFLRSDAYYKVK